MPMRQGPQILTASCYCTSCQEAGRRFEELEVRARGGRECFDPLLCGDWKGDAPKQTSNSASVRESSENTFACQTPCLGGGKLLEPGKERRDAVQRQRA
jgi:hypothetical protein